MVINLHNFRNYYWGILNIHLAQGFDKQWNLVNTKMPHIFFIIARNFFQMFAEE